MKKPLCITSLTSKKSYKNEGGFVLVVGGSQSAQWSEKAQVIIKSEGAPKTKEMPLETVYKTGTELHVDWPATLNRSVQVYDLFVRDDDGSESNIMTYTVTPHGVDVGRIVPNPIIVNPDQTSTINLHITNNEYNFATDVVVLAGNEELERRWHSSVYLTVKLPAHFVKKVQDVEILIFNPGAKGDEPAKVILKIVDPTAAEEVKLPPKAEEAVKKAEEAVTKEKKEKQKFKWLSLIEMIIIIFSIIVHLWPESEPKPLVQTQTQTVTAPAEKPSFWGKGIARICDLQPGESRNIYLDEECDSLYIPTGCPWEANFGNEEVDYYDVMSDGSLQLTGSAAGEEKQAGNGNVCIKLKQKPDSGEKVMVTLARRIK